MGIAGDYRFHSMLSLDEDETKYLTAEELINKPAPEDMDPEFAEHEKAETIAMTKTILRIHDDGTLKIMQPIPEGVSQEEVDAAIASGEILVEDGYIYDKVLQWEDRDGVIYYNTGIEGTIFDEKADPWTTLFDNEGYVNFMFMRFKK